MYECTVESGVSLLRYAVRYSFVLSEVHICATSRRRVSFTQLINL